MPRHPDWFGRLPAIEESLRASPSPSLGRPEIGALFGASERDAIRLLHKFGAQEQANALVVERSVLLLQLEAVRRGSAYQAFERQRAGIAGQLAQARSETAARQFRVRAALPEETAPGLDALPATIAWQRTDSTAPGRFSIEYDNGEDLLWQLAEFLAAASRDRALFFAGTEPASGPAE